LKKLILLSCILLLSILPVIANQDTGTLFATHDACIQSGALPSNQNFGASTTCTFSSGNKFLVKFDLSSIPAGAEIINATMGMRYGTYGGGVSNIFGLNQTWNEGTGTGTTNSAIINGVTWNERFYGTNWINAGVGTSERYSLIDMDGAILSGTACRIYLGQAQTYICHNITNITKAIMNNSFTYEGFILTGSGTMNVYTKDSSGTGSDPAIRIFWQYPQPVFSLAPTNNTLNNSKTNTFQCNVTNPAPNGNISGVGILLGNTNPVTLANYEVASFNNSVNQNGINYSASLTTSTDGTKYWACVVNTTFVGGGSVNNTYSEVRHIRIDTEPPVITFVSPSNNSFHLSSPNILYTVTDSNLDKCWYSNNSGVTNSTPSSSCSNLTSTNYSNGVHTIRIYANDTLNQMSFKDLTFKVFDQEPVSGFLNYEFIHNLTDIHLNFSVVDIESNPSNVSIKWYVRNTSGTFHLPSYDYSYTNVVSNTSVLTTVGTGSLPESVTTMYNDYFVQLNSTNINQQYLKNTSVVKILPMTFIDLRIENKTRNVITYKWDIIYPPDENNTLFSTTTTQLLLRKYPDIPYTNEQGITTQNNSQHTFSTLLIEDDVLYNALLSLSSKFPGDSNNSISGNNDEIPFNNQINGKAYGWVTEFTNLNYKREIIIPKENISGRLFNNTITLNFDSSNFDFNRILSSCADIRFSDYPEYLSYDYEIINCNKVGQNLQVKVKIPYMTSNYDLKLFIYYSNSTSISSESTDLSSLNNNNVDFIINNEQDINDYLVLKITNLEAYDLTSSSAKIKWNVSLITINYVNYSTNPYFINSISSTS